MDGVDVVLVGPSLDETELEAARSAMEQQMVGALELVREQRTDVLLLDVQMPGLPAVATATGCAANGWPAPWWRPSAPTLQPRQA